MDLNFRTQAVVQMAMRSFKEGKTIRFDADKREMM